MSELKTNPFFSILIVSLNPGESLQKTVNTVEKQTFTNYEIIIKDAKSIDGSVNRLKKNENIKIYIENDNGIYYGMNQGIEKVNGKYVVMLNCGDLLFEESTLEKIHDFIKKQADEPDIIYSDYVRDGVLFSAPSTLKNYYMFKSPLCHQSMYVKLDTYLKYGKYDISYQVASDYEFEVRSFFNKLIKFEHCPFPTCVYEGGGFSEVGEGLEKGFHEIQEIQQRYFKKFKKYKFIQRCTFVGLRRKLVSDKAPRFLRKIYRGLINYMQGKRRK